MVNKSLFKLSISEQIDWLARYIIIHSLIYYEFDCSVVSDLKYDEYSRYLAKLIKENPNDLKNCYYKDVIYDFDGSTGFYLKDRLTEEHKEYLMHLALNVLNHSRIDETKRKDRKSGKIKEK